MGLEKMEGKNGYVWKFNQFSKLAKLILREKFIKRIKKMNDADVIIVNGEALCTEMS